MKTFPRVSIIIPCFNAKNLIVNCLKSILKTEYPDFEVLITDDCSTDGTYQILVNNYSRNKMIKILQNSRNSGPSVTRNRGISHASGKYIAFYETDMEVDKNWLKPLILALEKDKSLGAVQSKILDLNKKDYIHSTGVYYDPHTFWVLSFACGSPKELFNNKTEIGIGAVGSVIRKDVLDKIGGFDERIVHNIDDIELGWRVWMAGFRSITIPTSITYHWTGKPLSARAKSTPGLASEFYFQKTPRIFLKDYEWKNVIKYLPWVLVIFFIRAVKNLLQGNPNSIRGYFKALFWNILVLGDTLQERKRVQKFRKKSDEWIMAKIGLKGNFLDVYFRQITPRLNYAMDRFRDS